MKNKLKILKSIGPDQEQKEKFRDYLISCVTQSERQRLEKHNINSVGFTSKIFLALNSLKLMPIASLLLLISLLGGGTVFASQSAVPGNTLYPIKLAAEKVEVALATDNVKKASLHLEFASERLNELNKIVGNSNYMMYVKDEQLDQAVAQYKKELDESDKILSGATSQKPQIAKLMDKETELNKKIITAMFDKIGKTAISKKLNDNLKEAYEHAESKNDNATMALFSFEPDHIARETNESDVALIDDSATSTDDNIQQGLIQKSRDKINSVRHKIAEIRQFIEKTKSRGYDTMSAESKLATAQNMLAEAEKLMEDKKYFESFLKSKSAQKIAQNAKELAQTAQGKINKKHGDSYEFDDDYDDRAATTTDSFFKNNDNASSTVSAINNNGYGSSTESGIFKDWPAGNSEEGNDRKKPREKEKERDEVHYEDRD